LPLLKYICPFSYFSLFIGLLGFESKSYLPGQEEGNVDFVLESKFGSYQEDPTQIAREVSSWLGDPDKLCSLSKAAKRHGTPRAAANIAIDIGDSTLRWKEIQEAE